MTEQEADVEMIDTENKPQLSVDAKGTAKLDELMSRETLRESPVQWPELFPGMEEFLTTSSTPIHTPTNDANQIMCSVNMAALNQFARMPPEQLLAKINAMHDQIYELGLLESKEMTRGKLLGIFDRERLTKTKVMRE